MSILKLENLNICIGERKLIDDSSLVINPGDAILLSGKNGSGKSTIIKLLMNDLLDYSSITGFGQIIWNQTIDLSESNNRHNFNVRTCYIPQEDYFEADTIFECCINTLLPFKTIENKAKYIFDFVKRERIYNSIFANEHGFKFTRKGKLILQKAGIPIKQANIEDKKVAQYLGMNPMQMSGGQKKIANILCNIVKVDFCELCIIDEPLNALDFENVRMFSNFLTSLSQNNKKLAFLIVSHCRCLPIINKVYKIEKSKIIHEEQQSKCYSCFGEIDDNSMYI